MPSPISVVSGEVMVTLGDIPPGPATQPVPDTVNCSLALTVVCETVGRGS
jgi:hypothetical protein